MTEPLPLPDESLISMDDERLISESQNCHRETARVVGLRRVRRDAQHPICPSLQEEVKIAVFAEARVKKELLARMGNAL